MNFDKPFWKTVFRESDGTASSSRLFCACIIASALSWVSYVTVKHTAIPDLAPVGTFVVTTTLALYGVNKVASTIGSVTNSVTKQD